MAVIASSGLPEVHSVTASTWLRSRSGSEAAAARAVSVAAFVSAKRSSRKRQMAAPAWASARPGSSAPAAWKSSSASASQPSSARTPRS